MPHDASQATDHRITAVLGPTNTGKTHYAIERMLARPSGVIGLPLRLLAREVYDTVVALRGRHSAALITGEERIQPAQARYFVCTVEAMPLDIGADFLAVDEIQLAADPERGHVFTDRLLRARGRLETIFMGSQVIRPRIASLVPEARFVHRERFSTLSYTGPRKISRLKPRSAVVAFSADQVYAIAELIRRQRGGAAVVMGALSPRTRNAQVALYQEGDVDYLVATDAIGMGLNLDVDHVAFAGLGKFDGNRQRWLLPNELSQIAGRAGRYTRDGSFGVTGEARPLDAQVVEAIESHRFKPLDRLMWRNHRLNFGTVPALIESLETAPPAGDLARGREADDLTALRRMCADPALCDTVTDASRVRLLWDVCQIPDFRKTMNGEHATLLSRIYRFLLSDAAVIPASWLAEQVARIDRTDGDIDTLSTRLAYIRTWTYVANRARWLEEPEAWRDRTRAVEDRLSDALHDRLTKRFVDRRTSILMRRLKQKERLLAEVNDAGEVTVEGEFVGRLSGFRFSLDDTASEDERKTLQSASVEALRSELARRADKFYLSPDSEIDLTEQGGLMWGSDAVGRLEKGETALTPRVRAFVDELADPAVVEKIERRLSHWVQRRISTLFEPMLAMQGDEAVTGLARGVAFQISEAMGIVPRARLADDLKALGQEERGLLRKHGLRFGQHHVFMPALLKPAPTRLRLVLWGLWQDIEDIPSAPPPGLVTVPADGTQPDGYYTMAGYRLCETRAIRIDMLERLADLLRPMDARGGFEATADMLSITGCTLEQFAELMQGLGYTAERGERVKGRPVPEPATGEPTQAPDAADAATADEGEARAATDNEAGAETEVHIEAQSEARPCEEEQSDATGAGQAGGSTASGPLSETAAEADADAETLGPPPAAALEEPEMEVSYLFRHRPRGRPPRDRSGKGAPRPPRRKPTAEAGAKPQNGGAKKKPKRRHGSGGGDKPVDPDNPFAILQQLKNR